MISAELAFVHEVTHLLCDEEDDPEHTLFVQLSRAELGLILLGLCSGETIFPCLQTEMLAVVLRVKELMGAQGWQIEVEPDGE